MIGQAIKLSQSFANNASQLAKEGIFSDPEFSWLRPSAEFQASGIKIWGAK